MLPVDASALGSASREELIALVVMLSEQVSALTARITEQDARIAEQDAVIAELTEKLAAATATSRTSSKPPSSDGLRKPPTPAPTSRRTKTGRKPGGQLGHDGAALAQVADPDDVIDHRPRACSGCAASLADAVVTSIAARQVADLPENVRLAWTEHRIATCVCECGARTSAGVADGVPAGVSAPVQYGPRVRAAAAWLVAEHYLPIARAAAVLAGLSGAAPSAGSVATWTAAAGDALAADGGFLDAVAAQLADADVLHADETGLRTAGSLAWVHVACTLALVLLSVHTGDGRRGRAAIDRAGVIGNLKPGAVLVSDYWAPYFSYAAVHALCGAHVVRELRAVCEAAPACTTEDGSQSWAGKMLHFLESLNAEVRTARQEGRQELDPAVLAAKVTTFEKILALGHEQNPPPPGGWLAASRRPKAVNLLLRIEGEQKAYLRFARDFAVPFTNNQAERDLRGVKLRQKISGCLRTVKGAEVFVAIRSYLLTAQRQGRASLVVLRELFEGRVWIPQLATT
ncbi:IS66 family transposase [Quadrisphaera granulorum]|uniref:IS66 family transposase n=1 Tax=Quadrisphaera granulorum TaxID=317664 RepID=UPI0011B46E9F|nr:IS66 family transposase [Quadrisphaera granulorum]